MAIYYLNAQVISRSAGRSAVAAAAYRAGEKLRDERTGEVHDYSRRSGEIHAEVMAPAGAPEWAMDRAELWNQAEKAERRGDAQVAREIVVALPRELSPDQQRELLRCYVQEQFVSRGMVADVAMHRMDEKNPHAHLLLTMREIGPEGFAAKKNREWNRPEVLEQWRAQWADHANRALERAGERARIDHRSYERQGIEKDAQVHMGPKSTAMERMGVKTREGEYNRTVIDLNAARAERDVVRREKDRLQTGFWRREEAAAVADVERRLGRPAGVRDLYELREGLRVEHTQVQREIHRIEAAEPHRLNQAGEALDHYNRTKAELDQTNGLWQKTLRFFGNDRAKVARDGAQQRLEWAEKRLQDTGVRSEADLTAQRRQWEQDRQRLPDLRGQFDGVASAMNMVGQALDAFRRAADRERMAEREQERARDGGREMDRGR